jgi:hypothetical protein
MDGAAVSRIERWTRHLLETEARKRGVRDPAVHSRSELLWAIAQHDYGARQSLRSARKLLGSILDGATQALPLFGSLRGQSAEKRPATLPSTASASSAQPTAAAVPPTAPQQPLQPSRLQLRREDGQLELSWQVNELDTQRALRLLGQQGELSLRIVCVQADPTQVVSSSVTEHGPLDPHGVWTWALPGPESHCVGAVGVRHGDRFVSIAHESSRALLG